MRSTILTEIIIRRYALIYLNGYLRKSRNLKEKGKRIEECWSFIRNCSMDFPPRSLTIRRRRATDSLGKLRITCFSIKYTETCPLGNTEAVRRGGWRKISREIHVYTLIANFVEILLNFIKFDIERETSLFLIMYIEFKLHFINFDFLRIKIISLAK